MTSITSSHNPIPGPGRYIPASDLQAIWQSPLEALLKIAHHYGDIFQYPVGFWTIYVINRPDFVRHVLQHNYRNYSKQTFQYRLLSGVAGEGLLTNDGESWLSQRRLAQPAFHHKQLALLGADMVQAALKVLNRWETVALSGHALDVDAEMMRLTLEIVGQSLFSTDLSQQADRLVEAVLTALDHIIYRARMPFALPNFIPTARNRRFQAALQQLDEAVAAMITARRGSESKPYDLLSMLMAARDEETGAGMSDQQLRDEIVTLLIAGHETVASALTWTWYFLSTHPLVERKLDAELRSVLAGRLPTVADLPQLPYTRQVFEESLRLYPPAWIITRKALADDEIGGYHIPANALLVISPYVIHRHPEFWHNPAAFDPERFTPSRSSKRPRFAYLPFGGGPRLCIGNHYSLMEGQLILATLAQHYSLSLLPHHSHNVAPLVTLRPKGGLWMKLHKKP